MKFYMVCAWDQYYPNGGIGNIKAVFDSLLDAENYMQGLQDVQYRNKTEEK